MTGFKTELNNYIKLIDSNLCVKKHFDNPQYKSVVDAMYYSVSASGKRLRPILTLEFCRVLGGDIQKAIPFACAVEYIHCYSLIHDDLPCMDDDDLRRGRPACHIAFGESIALLAGDGLLNLAFEVMSNAPKTSGVDESATLQAIRVLSGASGANGMIAGQVIDLESEQKQIDYETVLRMHSLKTGALIKAAALMGGIIAGAGQDSLNMIAEYASKLGFAFQIRDDILDVCGDQEILGKPVGSDMRQKKTNFISLFGLEKSKQIATEVTNDAKKILNNFDDNKFLINLTDMLLGRQK